MLDQLQNDVDAMEAMAKGFWRTPEGRCLSEDDREDVVQTALRLLYTYKFDGTRKNKKGEYVSRETYMRHLIPLALKVWRANQKIRTEAFSQLEAQNSDEFKRSEELLSSVPDPLSVKNGKEQNQGGLVISDLPGDDELISPPYKVIFTRNTPFLEYRRNPYFIPYFRIEPRYNDVLAVGTHSQQRGRRRRFGKAHLSLATMDRLEQRRSILTKYIRTLLPKYLFNFGFTSLEPRHMAIVADITRHGLTPSQIQAKRRITESTYYAYLAVLQRRGWIKVWHQEKQREVLQYHPVYDRCNSLYSTMLADLDCMDIQGVLEIAGPIIQDQLYEETADDAAIGKELRVIRRQMREATFDDKAEAEYDRRLRSFITDLVERPFEARITTDQLEEIFGRLPFTKRLNLFCEAIRTKKSIADVLGFSDYFAEVTYEPDPKVDLPGLNLGNLLSTPRPAA